MDKIETPTLDKIERPTLDKEMQELCNASPLEILNYYFVYPNQLVSDAKTYNKTILEYFYEVFMKAFEQFNNKN